MGYYKSKIGAHKCNSIKKLKHADNFFKIIELDLHYTELNTFDVFHPDDSSKGIKLEEYLSYIEPSKGTFLWLDIKNLKPYNSLLVFNKLNELISKYELNKKQLLIETRYPLALPIFTKNKFNCSYYITTKLYKLEDYELKKNIDNIKLVVKQQPKIGISFDYKSYSILSQHFPLKHKYTWNLSRLPLKNYFKTRGILNDNTVKIMLTSFNTDF